MEIILKDPGADSGGKGKSKRAKKKMTRRITFLCAIFTACLDFPLPPLSAPGSPSMYGNLI